MKRQRAEISSNVISYIKSAHPIEMWCSNKLGIKEKISRGKFPRLIFSCPVPSGLPHRSHCVPMNMNPCGFKTFNGAAGQIGTADLILTKDALYRLSYSSKWRPGRGSNPRPPAWQAGVLTSWTTWPFTYLYVLTKNKFIITFTNRFVKYFLWQGQKDSNSRHAVLETAALPAELYP